MPRNTITKLLACATAFAAAIPLMADTETVNGVTWTYNVQDGEATIIAPNTESSCGNIPGLTGSLVIPSALGGHPVTCLAAGVLWGASELTSLVIPDSVRTIENGALNYLTSVTNVSIGVGVTSFGMPFLGCIVLKSIEVADANPAFCVKDGVLYDKALTRLLAYPSELEADCFEIPDSVSEIGIYAFDCPHNLTRIVVPDGVTAVHYAAFNECYRLESLVFKGNAPQVFGNVFRHPSDFCTIYIEKGATGWDDDGDGKWEGVMLSYDDGPVVPAPAKSGDDEIAPVAGDIAEAYSAPRAVTLQGAVYDGDGAVVGIVELKLGKVNDRKHTGKVSGSVTTLDGKKHAAKAANLTGIDGTTPQEVTLEIKDMGTMAITIGGTQFAGSLGGKYHVQSVDVGDDLSGTGTKGYVIAADSSLPAGTLEDLLPTGEPVDVANGKWKFHKAAKVKWAKPKKGTVLPEIYDEVSGKGLVMDTSAGKTNLSGMKLNYVPKKGTFKGSFKVYALEGEGKSRKLKKYTVKVSGVVVGGFGYGEATIKGFPPITVEIH